jgi:uncharacterized RDD family membrane protein YckC
MNCPYCQASNVAGEHRCQRCGRRLDSTDNPHLGQAYGRAATARALQFESPEKPEQRAETAQPGVPKRSSPFQPSLFQTRVVSFDSFAPEAVESRPRTRNTSPSRLRHKRTIPGQESFQFETYETVITQAAPPSRTVEPTIGCGVRAALPLHRLLAAAYDFSMVIIAVALFLLVFYLAGGRVVLNAHTAPLCAGVAAVFYLMYELLWCMADTDSAGMRWAHLKLVDFDGGAPVRDQRLFRIAAGGLSVLAAGLGILWAFVDEESLTWHDHISKTFPTPF